MPGRISRGARELEKIKRADRLAAALPSVSRSVSRAEEAAPNVTGGDDSLRVFREALRCFRSAPIAARAVTCRQDPRDPEDRYERALGLCEVGEGEELNEGMVAARAAVAYRQYLDYRYGQARAYRARMIAAGRRASTAKVGIRRGRSVRPDLWRKGER
jgi:hypothetical protein